MTQSCRLTVPASTANLGSGFDTLGMALLLRDIVEVTEIDGLPGTAEVEVTGEGEQHLPTGERHLVVRALHRTLAELDVEAPALRVRCSNEIPQSRGLGSSAAAIVAGVAAGYQLAGLNARDNENSAHALHLAASIEGHADNVAASLLGGLVIAWSEDGRFRATHMEPHMGVRPVALIPETTSATHATRGLLPDTVAHGDAAFAASRSALLVHAMTTNPDLLFPATEDRLHQDYREPAWPSSIAVIRRLRGQGIAAAISGAGPTVLAFPKGGHLPADVDTSGFRVVRLPVDLAGVRVVGGSSTG